jgi:tripartite ATP-independent transporter DctP family solute receptor
VVELTFAQLSIESAILGGRHFKEVAERESGGTLIINLFENNVLGDDRSVVEQTIFGDIQLAATSSSPIANMHNDLFVFDAPFLFLNEEQADAVLDGPVGQAILADMEGIGLKGLLYWENGFRHFTAASIPVTEPADVQGVTIRTMENEIHMALWQAFGANPTPMAMPEVFTALQQGTIDAQENTIGTIDGFGLYEIQHYISMTSHVYTPFMVVMNLDTFNSLSENQQQAILTAAASSVEYQRRIGRENDARLIQGWIDAGTNIIELTDAQKSVFQGLAIDGGVWDMIRGRMDNPQYLDDIIAQLGL